MKNFIKKLYYSIICYDPIIEKLKEKNISDFEYDNLEVYHIASPIQPNRKQKRNFWFEHIKSDVKYHNNK